jgi:hypothetical protein
MAEAGKGLTGVVGTVFNQINPLPGGKAGRTALLGGTSYLAYIALTAGTGAALTVAWAGAQTVGTSVAGLGEMGYQAALEYAA